MWRHCCLFTLSINQWEQLKRRQRIDKELREEKPPYQKGLTYQQDRQLEIKLIFKK